MSQLANSSGPWSQAGASYEAGTTKLAQLAALNGGQVPAAVDIQVILGKDAWSVGSGATIGVWQSPDFTSGQATVLANGDVEYGQTRTWKGVPLDPNGGGIALFVPGPLDFHSNVDATLQVVPSGQALQSQGGLNTQSIADDARTAAKKVADEAAKHAEEVFEMTLVAGGILIVVIIGMVMVWAKPSLPAQIAGSGVDALRGHREASPAAEGA